MVYLANTSEVLATVKPLCCVWYGVRNDLARQSSQRASTTKPLNQLYPKGSTKHHEHMTLGGHVSRLWILGTSVYASQVAK